MADYLDQYLPARLRTAGTMPPPPRDYLDMYMPARLRAGAPPPVAPPVPARGALDYAKDFASDYLLKPAQGLLSAGSAAAGGLAGLGAAAFGSDAYQRALDENASGLDIGPGDAYNPLTAMRVAPGPGQVLSEAFAPGEQDSAPARIGKRVGALVGDIALDPMNWATGGLAATSKLGKFARTGERVVEELAPFLKGGAEAARTLSRGEAAGRAATAALGSASAGLVYAPEIVQGTLSEGQQAAQAFRQGDYGAAAEHGIGAALTGALGGATLYGVRHDFKTAPRTAAQPGEVGVSRDEADAILGLKPTPPPQPPTLPQVFDQAPPPTFDRTGPTPEPTTVPGFSQAPPPPVWNAPVPQGFEAPQVVGGPNPQPDVDFVTPDAMTPETVSLSGPEIEAERAALTPDREAMLNAEQRRLYREYRQSRPEELAAQAVGEALAPPGAPRLGDRPPDPVPIPPELATVSPRAAQAAAEQGAVGTPPPERYPGGRGLTEASTRDGAEVQRLQSMVERIPQGDLGRRLRFYQRERMAESARVIEDEMVRRGQQAQPTPTATTYEQLTPQERTAITTTGLKIGDVNAMTVEKARDFVAPLLNRQRVEPVDNVAPDQPIQDAAGIESEDRRSDSVFDRRAEEPSTTVRPKDDRRTRGPEDRRRVAEELQVPEDSVAVDRFLAERDRADEADVIANTDVKTGLKNARGWDHVLKTVNEDTDSVVTIDLKGFKETNDRIGHKAGDEVLASVGGLVRKHFGEESARPGGDEFNAVMRNAGDQAETRAAAFREELRALKVQVKNPVTGELLDIPFMDAHIGIGRDADESDLAQNIARDLYGSGRKAEAGAPPGERGPVQGTTGEAGPGLGDRPAELGEPKYSAQPKAPAFYSALQRAVEQKIPAAGGPSAQILKTLQNTQGVKPDEIKWTGLDDFLRSRERVTREDVLQHLRENAVEVKEVTKGGDADARQRRLDSANDALLESFRGDGRARHANDIVLDTARGDLDPEVEATFTLEQREMARELRAAYEARNAGDDSGKTKFGQFTLPGGENYRELLLTLPAKEPKGSFDEFLKGYRERFPTSRADDGMIRDYWRNGNTLPMPGRASSTKDPANFRSSHYDEPNILAHVRFNERTDADGKRVLFVEEIQSDWAQKGRREGFKKDIPAVTEKDVDLRRVERQPDQDPRTHPGYWESFDRRDGSLITRHGGVMSREAAMREAIQIGHYYNAEKNASGVPSAPFVDSTEKWTGLAAKRVLRYAAENGFDRVAWTTGEQQAARYDLSKQIDHLRVLEGNYEEAGGEGYEVTARKGGQEVLRKRVPASGLPDLIGKEMADKAVRQIDENKKRPVPMYVAEFSGVDLQVGGEGMKGFYDKILPGVFEKLGKKWGAKVGQTALEIEKIPRKAGESDADRAAFIAKYGDEVISRAPVHSLDVTPEMRRSVVQEGQPLFRAGQTEPAVRITTEHVQRAFPSGKITATDGGHLVDLPHGRQIRVTPNAEIEVNLGKLKAAHPEVFDEGGKLRPEMGVTGSWQKIDRGGLIRLAKAGDEGTLSHETFHAAMDLVLTPKEKAAVLKRYDGSEEKAADAYAAWKPSASNTLFGKITKFFWRIYRAFKPSWESAFGEVRSGKAFERAGETSAGEQKYATARERALLGKRVAEGAVPARGYGEQGFKHSQPVRVTFPDGSVHYDEIKGLNQGHAIARAEANWSGAKIEALTKGELDYALNLEEALGDARESLQPKYATAPKAPPETPQARGPLKPIPPSAEQKATYAAGKAEGGRTTGKPPDEFVNLDRASSDEDIRKLVSRVADARAKEQGEAKSYRSWEEAREKAVEAGITESDFKRMVKEGAVSDHVIEAGRMLRTDAFKSVQENLRALNDAAKEGKETADLEAAYESAINKAAGVLWSTTRAGAEAGRALAIHRKLAEGMTEQERLYRKIAKGRPGLSEGFARRVLATDTNDSAALAALIRSEFTPSKRSMAYEFWINGLLSGPPTHLANAIGNTLSQLGRIGEKAVAGGIDAARVAVFGGERERFVGEAMADIQGIKEGLPKAMRAFSSSWNDELLAFREEGKVEYSPKIPGQAGKVIRTPTRLLSASDQFAKAIVATREARALAYRKARMEGKTGSAIPQRMAEILSDLDAHPDIAKGMAAEADYQTFTKTVGKFGQMLRAARDSDPTGFAKVVVPFFNTPLNIAKYTLERTPLNFIRIAAMAKKGELKGGALSEELAKATTGTMIGVGLAMMAHEGLITGGGPADPKENETKRKTGWQPYSLHVGDQYISIQRLEPFSSIAGFAADMVEAKDEKTTGDLVDKIVGSVAENLTNKTFLQGLENAFLMWSDPKRYASQWAKNLEGSAVPAIFGRAAQAIDPTFRETSAFDGSAIAARIPGVSTLLQPKRSGTGEPVERGGSAAERFLSPAARTTEKGPEADLERVFLEIDYVPSRPAKSVTVPGSGGKKVELTDSEYREFQKADERITQRLRKMVADPRFRRMSTEAQRKLIKSRYELAGDDARRRVLPTVLKRFRQNHAGSA